MGFVAKALLHWRGGAVGAGLAYFALATAAVLLSRLDGGVATVWVANGVLVAWLSITRRRYWRAILASAFAGNAIATVAFGAGWAGLGLPVINMAESFAAVYLLRRWAGPHYLDTVEGVGKFLLVAGLLVPAAASLPASLVAAWALEVGIASSALNWFAGHALGTITVTPVAILVLRRLRGWGEPRRRVRTISTWLFPVVVVTAMVFWQESLPLLFLPLLPMMIATLRLGRVGAAASICLVAAIATLGTLTGHGPVYLIEAAPLFRLQFLQFYLACTAGAVLPLAALLKQRRLLIERLSESEAGYRLLTDYSGDVLLHCDRNGRIQRAVGGVAAFEGLTIDQLPGHNVAALVHPEDIHLIVAVSPQLEADPEATVTFEYRARTGSGYRWCESRARAVLGEDGTLIGSISAIRDIAARKVAEEELARAATTDPLTGLMNRRAFFAALEGRDVLHPSILVMADLDHFKSINDRFGHPVGDVALKTFAGVARRALRSTDLVARVGGEEFAFLLTGVRIEEAESLCARLRELLHRTPFEVAPGQTELVTASMGLAVAQPGDTGSTLLARADAALYAAKAAGRDCWKLAA